MRFRSYNEEIKIATGLVLDVFNDIVIDRRDSEGNIQQEFTVPCVFGNRSRIIKSLYNPEKHLEIPLIVISRGDISRDTSRVHSVNLDLKTQVDGHRILSKITPNPVNITFEMTILTRYIEDLDQIFSNFIPWFNPDIYVVWNHPKYPIKKIKSQLIWDGSASTDLPEELSETDPFRCIGTTSFTFKTWIFAGIEAIDDESVPLIEKINFTPSLIEIGEDGYMLDRFYGVPHYMSIPSFMENIKIGLIKNEDGYYSYDYLPISGGLSGYWQEISGALSGSSEAIELSANGAFLVAQDGNLLIFSDASILTEGMQQVDFQSWYQELTGNL